MAGGIPRARGRVARKHTRGTKTGTGTAAAVAATSALTSDPRSPYISALHGGGAARQRYTREAGCNNTRTRGGFVVHTHRRFAAACTNCTCTASRGSNRSGTGQRFNPDLRRHTPHTRTARAPTARDARSSITLRARAPAPERHAARPNVTRRKP